jgi:phosphoribosylamine-glycine ligase
MLVAEGYPDSYSKGMKINVNRVVNKIFYSGVSGNSDNLMAAGGRILSITAIAKNKILARNKVYADIKKVNISHSRYRRDIGI